MTHGGAGTHPRRRGARAHARKRLASSRLGWQCFSRCRCTQASKVWRTAFLGYIRDRCSVQRRRLRSVPRPAPCRGGRDCFPGPPPDAADDMERTVSSEHVCSVAAAGLSQGEQRDVSESGVNCTRSMVAMDYLLCFMARARRSPFCTFWQSTDGSGFC